MIKLLLRLTVFGVVFAGGYFLLNQESVSSYTIPFIEVTKREANKAINKFSRSVKDYGDNLATSTIFDLTDSLEEKSGEILTKIFDGAKTEGFNFFRQTVNKKVNSFGSNLGIDIQQAKIESPVVLGIQVGSLAYFTIKNRESEKIRYEANWLDGIKNNGEISAGKAATLSHRWNFSGEYYPKFKIITSAGEKTYEIAISVISL